MLPFSGSSEASPLAGPPRSAKQLAQDELVMSTNSSSIVSKRSVERLGYTQAHADEVHFFRFFVKKFQRRAPLINRGYHLRLHAIDSALQGFLGHGTRKTKVVINLGCGSDVIPWQCWNRYPEASQGARFIDVDFPDLIMRKRQIVMNTPELREPLVHVETFDDIPISLASEHYCQIGCDLRQLSTLQSCLESLLDLPNCTILFLSEVSITYAETEVADAVIQWASRVTDDSRFLLLEQLLPDGPEHPFAKTMLQHFNKLNTPIKSVDRYPTLSSQNARFVAQGWRHVKANNLWQLWADDNFISSHSRRHLNLVEPFDEWEEFALFATHYCVVQASTHAVDEPASTPSPSQETIPLVTIPIDYCHTNGNKGLRKFASPMEMYDTMSQPFFGNFLGLGFKHRLRSYDLYKSTGASLPDLELGDGGPSARMCHSTTDLGGIGILLVGGRTSPAQALKDAWLFRPVINRWERTFDLPVPLYRHSVARLSNSSLALVIGGKTDDTAVSGSIFVYHPLKGWLTCTLSSSVRPVSVFGAILTCTGSHSQDPSTFHGVLAGGLLADGAVADQTLAWVLDCSNIDCPKLTFSDCVVVGERGADPAYKCLVNRFGASCIDLGEQYFVVIGGIVAAELLRQDHDIILCRFSQTTFTCEIIGRLSDTAILREIQIPRPLLVGSSALKSSDGRIVIFGGGATCFSMGSFWNRGVYTLDINSVSDVHGRLGPAQTRRRSCEFWKSVDVSKDGSLVQILGASSPSGETVASTINTIPRSRLENGEDFERSVRAARPLILDGVALGACVQRWTTEYLKKTVDPEQTVVVHESTSRAMDFNAKNFSYISKSFSSFIREVEQGNRLYLRALSSSGPAREPANLAKDFPTLSGDFVLPPELSLVSTRLFSSVLRISGPVDMWLHYDVMANVYCQIQGSKRFLLFPPSDVRHIPLSPGASSSSIDVFAALDSPIMKDTHPHEAILGPGDILLIPPLWLHTATPISETSIAVNVFFRDLDTGYAPGRDVYGNRDLAAYEKGRQDVCKIASNFQKLPQTTREFYAHRLSNELLHKTAS